MKIGVLKISRHIQEPTNDGLPRWVEKALLLFHVRHIDCYYQDLTSCVCFGKVDMPITGFEKSSDPRNPVNVVGIGVVFDLPVWLRAAVGQSVRELFRKIRSDLDRSVLYMTGACVLHRIYV